MVLGKSEKKREALEKLCKLLQTEMKKEGKAVTEEGKDLTAS